MPRKPPSTARLEAFSDGVIAVIITIMVLELKVPRQEGITGLFTILPTLQVYLLSFAFTGIYWINHQELIERVESADKLILYTNLLFLFCLSLIPFFTAYVLEKKIDSFAVTLYIVSAMASGFAYFFLRVAVHRHLRQSGRLEKADKAAKGKHLASLALYLAAIPLARVHPQIALGVMAFVTVIWIIPDLGFKSG